MRARIVAIQGMSSSLEGDSGVLQELGLESRLIVMVREIVGPVCGYAMKRCRLRAGLVLS
jgi:hypothetical protein